VNFREAEEYLLSLGNEVAAMKLGLENVTRLIAALGDPHTNYLKVQVAGTNGKGSVCAFLDAICLAARIRVGVFTSPHLVSMTERIRIGGTDIRQDDFARIATQVREASEKLVDCEELAAVPTYFEQVTAIALLAFAEAGVELAILETGLGGRYDATTAADAEIAAITRIDIDHQEYLGETLAEIAAEKAAIIRRDSQVVLGEQELAAYMVLTSFCADLGVLPRSAQNEVRMLGPTSFRTAANLYEVPSLGLAGLHQIETAKVAILTAEILGEYIPINRQAITDGLQNARHPGRLEWIGDVLLDGAHNMGGARALAAYLDEFVTRPITLVFGAMNDKDVGQIASILFPRAHSIILTEPANSRSLKVDELFRTVPPDISSDDIKALHNVRDAITAAKELAGEDGIILVTGSLYLVGEVKKLLNN
jgi:dihydrofolate synthase/folylpolyglutamate synthase